MDVKNTLEVLDFAKSVLKGLAAAKADDGKISLAELAEVALDNAPEAVKAAMGASDIKNEIVGIDLDEAKAIAASGAELAQLVLALIKK